MKIKGFQSATHDLAPIMPTLEEIMWKDNEEGLMRGTDAMGRPLARLAQSTLANPHRGPGGPLVPRGRLSRFIANYVVGSFRRGDGRWAMIGAWQNLVSDKGTPFASFHFEGRGRLPVRDLRGVRRPGKEKIRNALVDFFLGRLHGAPDPQPPLHGGRGG